MPTQPTLQRVRHCLHRSGVVVAGLQSQDQVLDRTIAVGITIEQQLRRNTITLGSDPAVELVDLNIDWQANPPLIRARVRVTNPQLPTQTQVAAVQEFINRRQSPRRYRLLVQRTAVDLIGPETAPNPTAVQDMPDPS